MESKSSKRYSSAKIGEKFVNKVIKEITRRIRDSGNVIEEYYTSSKNKFDLILTFPKRINKDKPIKGNSELAKKLIEKAKSIIIIECSKSGKFKAVKENLGEILKIPALREDIIKKIRKFYLVHERIENKTIEKFKKMGKLLFKPNLKIELVELKDLKNNF